jgi:hypothetical protein
MGLIASTFVPGLILVRAAKKAEWSAPDYLPLVRSDLKYVLIGFGLLAAHMMLCAVLFESPEGLEERVSIIAP